MHAAAYYSQILRNPVSFCQKMLIDSIEPPSDNACKVVSKQVD